MNKPSLQITDNEENGKVKYSSHSQCHSQALVRAGKPACQTTTSSDKGLIKYSAHTETRNGLKSGRVGLSIQLMTVLITQSNMQEILSKHSTYDSSDQSNMQEALFECST